MNEACEIILHGLTPNQREAATTFDRSVLVSAGAGSGKTRVLVARYLAILAQRLSSVDGIVAITFTRKAAGEMVERIRSSVDGLIEMLRGRPEESDFWQQIKKDLMRAHIGTIHSFCSNLIRENPVECHVDPRFEMLDETQAAILLDEAARSSVLALLEREGERYAELAGAAGIARLADQAARLYKQIRQAGRTIESVREESLISLDDDLRRFVCNVGRFVEDLSELALKENDPAVAKAGQTIEKLRELKSRLPDCQQAAQYFMNSFDHYEPDEVREKGQVLLGVGSLLGGKVANAVKEQFKDLKEFSTNIRLGIADALARPYFESLFELLTEIDRRYSEAKMAISGLDYADLQVIAYNLLSDHPHILAEYRERFKFIMVDEFQDVDGLQMRILSLLVGDPPTRSLFAVGDPKQSIYRFRGAEVSLFNIVRGKIERNGGKVVLLQENFRSQPGIISLVNQAFGKIMGSVETEDPSMTSDSPATGEPWKIRYEELCARKPAPDGSEDLERVRFVRIPDGGPEAEAQFIAEQIVSMVEHGKCLATRAKEVSGSIVVESRPVSYGDIAILFRAATNIKIYERALMKYGIPYYVVGGTGFYDRPEIQDILSTLRAVENEYDALSLAAALRSPIFGLSDETLLRLAWSANGDSPSPPLAYAFWRGIDAEGANFDRAHASMPDEEKEKLNWARMIMQELKQMRACHNAREMIETLLIRSGFENVLVTRPDGAQAVSNVRKILSIAGEISRTRYSSIGDFLDNISRLQEISAREEEATLEVEEGDTVKLLTIHKAKGLQFPVVIVPDIAHQRRRNTDIFSFDLEMGVGMKIPNTGHVLDPGDDWIDTSAYTRIHSLDDQKDREESKRILYVAATRAEDCLIMVGSLNGQDPSEAKGDTWLSWLQDVVPQDKLQIVTVPEGGSATDSAGEGGMVPPWPHAPLQRAGWAQKMAEYALVAHKNLSCEPAATLLKQVNPLPHRGRRISRFSVSALMAYHECPRRFFFQYRMSLPQSGMTLEETDVVVPIISDDDQLASGERLILPPIVRGNVIHRVCERLRRAGEVEEILEWALKAEGVPEAQLHPAKESLMGIIQHYLESDFFRYVADGVPMDNEIPFVFRLSDNIFLRGAADRVIYTGGARTDPAILVDFKTNVVDRSGISEILSVYELQSRVYAMALRAAGIPVEKAFIYFMFPDIVHGCDISLDALEAAKTYAIRVCGEMEAVEGLKGLRGNSRLCSQCGYQAICNDLFPSV